ncbi:MAG TPA: NAD(P)/FAD-dependent oxidoreductase, partial [Chthoniobacterales bacterium]|nr:NAD(P)/FAD-dependent oxidoreductase [Chthoniobacterales bacterium]
MIQHKDLDDPRGREVIIIGGGMAGLSAAIYLGRAQRDVLVIDAGKSMARWEPIVWNYLGFSEGVAGDELLRQGRLQAQGHDVQFVDDCVEELRADENGFVVRGEHGTYQAKRLLLATGIYHLPPDIPGVPECLGRSMFFCKDCDGYRVREKRVAICGANDESVEYALGILLYSPCVMIATNGEKPRWSDQHARWLEQYEIPVHLERIHDVEHREGQVLALHFADRSEVKIDNVFTTRGQVYHTGLAEQLGCELDEEGQLKVDHKMRTSVP